MKTYACPLERTNRSLFIHLEFLGLEFMILEKRTWAMGAMPMGAPEKAMKEMRRSV